MALIIFVTAFLIEEAKKHTCKMAGTNLLKNFQCGKCTNGVLDQIKTTQIDINAADRA